jgi:hypothetical protein
MKTRRHIYSKNPLGIIAATTLFTVLFTVNIVFGIKMEKLSTERGNECKTLFYC